VKNCKWIFGIICVIIERAANGSNWTAEVSTSSQKSAANTLAFGSVRQEEKNVCALVD
jgi:hypothetical protein